MADGVEYYMEQMIPGLEELQNAGLFAAPEIKAIVKKRRDFEYAIARPGKTKVDFFRYIEYEMNLDQLRRKRVERLGVTKKNGALHGIRHISSIFVRCLRKFKGDVNIWLQFIDFSTRIGSINALNRTFAEALQFHPTNPKLWILSASWEYEHNMNIGAARTLLQRGIRILPHNQELYIEYIRLELIYREKIRQRMELMGIDQSALKPKTDQKIDLDLVPMKADDDESDAEPEEDDGMRELLDLPEGDPSAEKKRPSTMASSVTVSEGKNPFFEGVVIMLVYNAAIAKMPTDVHFRQRILRVVQAFPFSETIQDQIYASLERDFPEDEDVIIMIARRPLDSLTVKDKENVDTVFDAIRKTIDNIDNEILRVDTVTLRQKFIETLMKMIASNKSDEIVSFLSRKLQTAFQDAIKSKNTNERILAHQISWFLSSGKLFEAIEASANCVKLHPSAADLWALRLKILLQIRGADSSLRIGNKTLKDYQLSNGELINLCEQAVKGCKTASNRLWILYADVLVATEAPHDKLLALFSKGAQRLKGDELDQFKQKFLTSTHKYLSAESIRKFYIKAFEFHPTKLEFYTKCINYEQSQLKPDERRIRQLYEYALGEYGSTDDDLWLGMIKWELSAGHMEEASSLYWRAKKSLTNPDDFVVKHSMLMNSDHPEKEIEAAMAKSSPSDAVSSSDDDDDDDDDDSDQHSDDDEDESSDEEEEQEPKAVAAPAKAAPSPSASKASAKSPAKSPAKKSGNTRK